MPDIEIGLEIKVAKALLRDMEAHSSLTRNLALFYLELDQAIKDYEKEHAPK